MKRLFIIIFTILLLSGCYSKEERKLENEYKIQGEKNAIKYVKEKYDIEPKVVSVKVKQNCSVMFSCLDSSPSDNVTVTFKYNKQKFQVFIKGNVETTDGKDNYQYDEIEKDMVDYIQKNINIKLYSYDFKLDDYGIKEFYNKDLNVIVPYISKFSIYSIGENNLESIDPNNSLDIFSKKSGVLTITNFKTKSEYNKYNHTYITNSYYAPSDYKNIYIDSTLKVLKDEKKYTKYNIANYNNELYIYDSSNNNSHEIKPSTLSDLSNYKNEYSNLEIDNIQLVSNVYSIKSSNSYLYLYFSKDTIKSRGGLLYLAKECKVNGEQKYYIDGLMYDKENVVFNNYYLLTTSNSKCDSNSDVSFGLVRIKKGTNYD